MLVLGACQGRLQGRTEQAAPTARPALPALAAPVLVSTDSAAAIAARPEKQTLFPDSLHPVEVSAHYWTGAQVDSLRNSTVREADSAGWADCVERWDAQLRMLQTDESTGKRLFFRPLLSSSRWVEVDLNTWLQNYNSLPYLTARAVELDHRPPMELLVAVGGSAAGPGNREMEDYTLLLSFNGPPHIIWHSLDGVREEISPTRTGEDGEMEGGNYADARRKITVRRSRVHVGRVQQEGTFEGGAEPEITPITPGTYAYRAGRFRRVGR